MKPYIGSTAYTLSCIREIFRQVDGTFDIEFDNGKHIERDVKTHYLQIYNGKFGGGRILLNPMGIINDGCMEVMYRPGDKEHAIAKAVKGIFMFLTPGGVMCYDEGF